MDLVEVLLWGCVTERFRGDRCRWTAGTYAVGPRTVRGSDCGRDQQPDVGGPRVGEGPDRRLDACAADSAGWFRHPARGSASGAAEVSPTRWARGFAEDCCEPPNVARSISVAAGPPGAVMESQPQESRSGAFLLQQLCASALRSGAAWELQQQFSARLAGKASSRTVAKIAMRAAELNRGVMRRTYRPAGFAVKPSPSNP